MMLDKANFVGSLFYEVVRMVLAYMGRVCHCGVVEKLDLVV